MSTENKHPINLLPWFVNGTLAGDELEYVSTHLASCNKCRQEVELLGLVREQVKSDCAENGPGELARLRFMNEIAKDVRQKKTAAKKSWWRPAVSIAAALVIVLQTAVIVNQAGNPSIENPGSKNGDIVIQFKSSATLNDINKLMASVKGRITDGPVKGTRGEIFYEAVIANSGKLSRKKIRDIIQKLKSQSDLVTYVDSMGVD